MSGSCPELHVMQWAKELSSDYKQSLMVTSWVVGEVHSNTHQQSGQWKGVHFHWPWKRTMSLSHSALWCVEVRWNSFLSPNGENLSKKEKWQEDKVTQSPTCWPDEEGNFHTWKKLEYNIYTTLIVHTPFYLMNKHQHIDFQESHSGSWSDVHGNSIHRGHSTDDVRELGRNILERHNLC